MLPHLKGPGHHNVAGQMGIEGVGQPVHGNGGVGPEIGNIAQGVHSRVGAAAAGNMNAVAHDLGCRLFHSFRHRGQVLLDLPAVITGAEIG